MDNLEKNKIVDMIRASFGNDISEIKIYRKRNIILDFLILGFGIIALIFYLFSSDVPILSEFILVFSWLMIEESVYNLIFTGVNNKITMERKRKITNCDIIFK